MPFSVINSTIALSGAMEASAFLDAFDNALNQIDAQQREPDGEEQDLLANALAYMICANYRLARVELRKLARPPLNCSLATTHSTVPSAMPAANASCRT